MPDECTAADFWLANATFPSTRLRVGPLEFHS